MTSTNSHLLLELTAHGEFNGLDPLVALGDLDGVLGGLAVEILDLSLHYHDLFLGGGEGLLALAEVVGDAEPLDPLNVGVVLGPLEVVLLLATEAFEGRGDFLVKNRVELIDLELLFVNGLHGTLLLRLVHPGSRGLLDHAEDFDRLHVEHLGDAALHDEEVGVVDIELHRVEKVLHLTSLGGVSVDKVFALPSNQDLPGYGDLGGTLVADGGSVGIRVVENNCHDSLVHSRLTLLVNQLVEVSGSDLTEVGDSQNEADGVENVTLSTSIQTRDGIEMRIKPVERGRRGVEMGVRVDKMACEGGIGRQKVTGTPPLRVKSLILDFDLNVKVQK